ncbi:hypothetical protein F5051DRAFT_433890, partial [Lentinula edodes]
MHGGDFESLSCVFTNYGLPTEPLPFQPSSVSGLTLSSLYISSLNLAALKRNLLDGIKDNARPKGLLVHATNWFSDHFGCKFTAPDPGNVLTHGTQDDFNNCGLVTINAIEHALWNDTEIWSSETKELHRHSCNRESLSLSECPRKGSHSPEFGGNAVQAISLSKLEDEDADFVITDNSDETDSVATVATDDGLYASIQGVGISKSLTWVHQQNAKYKKDPHYNSKNPKNRARMQKFLTKARRLDPFAEVIDSKRIRHSKCGKTGFQDAPFKLSNFQKHVKYHCNGNSKSKGAGCHTITSFFSNTGSGSQPQLQRIKKVPMPCPGLGKTDHPGVGLLLDCTGALGGGAPTVDALAHWLFGRKYRTLSLWRKQCVKLLQRREWKWENYHGLGHVYSTLCTCMLEPGDIEGPCFFCFSLLNLKTFRNAMTIPKPKTENYKFLNKEYRNELLAQISARSLGIEDLISEDPSKTPPLKYVLGILKGKFMDGQQNQFFGDLLKVINILQDKKDCGVGTEGFSWSPLMTQLAQIIAMISPSAYRALKIYIPLPEVCTLQWQWAVLPKFPVDIQPQTFALAKIHLDELFHGPVALSCDDTKLQVALRPYYDVDWESWCVLGSTDPDEYCKVVNKGAVEKASKLRLWCMQTCCPGIPSHILAAKAILSTLPAEELFRYFCALIDGLLSKGILVCSYACDGHSTITISIPVFSGARLLILPNSVVMYSQVREIAFQKGPIYNRDDDNAAARLFSASTIGWLSSNEHRSEENIGLLVYLFVFDALRSRTTSFKECCRMVLRTYFFLDLWEKYLDVTGYSKLKHFLFGESVDVLRINIRGFFQLLFIHCDHLPRQHALFLHLVGTSICEHVFGFSREIDKGFTMYSWYLLKPKITDMLRNAILSQQGKDGKARASGYNHSYLDRHGIDVAMLSTFPSDAKINESTKFAYDDTTSLFALLVGNEDSNELSLEEDEHSSSDETSEGCSLQDTINLAENFDPAMEEKNRRLMGYCFAAVALEIDKDMVIGALPEEDEETRAENISNDIECIGEMLTASLPARNHIDPVQPSLLSLSHMDLSELHTIQKAHETRLAASATCKTNQDDSKVNGKEKSQLSAEAQLSLAFQEIINEESKRDRGEGTGLNQNV